MKMKIKLIINALLLLLLFNACVTTPPRPQRNLIPNWYSSPTTDTPNYWFDTGVGTNKNEAIRKALSNIASKISVKVNSKFIDILREHNGHSENFNESAVEVSVENIQLPGYEIQQIQESMDKVYVLLRVSKQKFLNEKKNDFRIKNKTIKNMYSQMKTGHPIEIIKGKNKFNKLVSQAMTTAIILSNFNERYAIDKCLNEYMAYQKNIQSIMTSLNICIKSDPHSRLIASHIKELLTAENIHVVDQLSNPKNAAIINLKGSQKKLNIDNEYLVKITVDIIVKSPSSKRIISKKQHTFSGASIIDYRMAVQNAAKVFYNKSKSEGIYNTIGLQ